HRTIDIHADKGSRSSPGSAAASQKGRYAAAPVSTSRMGVGLAVTKLRIGLTISGAVSLGSYEGGALAALLVAIQEMNGAVLMDVVTGASAGAITAVLAARCLVRGCDPVQAMTASWVDLPSIERLKTHDPGAPLSAKVLAEGATALLGT